MGSQKSGLNYNIYYHLYKHLEVKLFKMIITINLFCLKYAQLIGPKNVKTFHTVILNI